MNLVASDLSPLGARGPYQLLEQLGTGGMGVVYRARHSVTGQQVALKTVRVPEAAMLHGLRREIHALSRLRHPGVVRILDQGVEEGLPWYAMEFIEGVSLRQWMDSGWIEGTAGCAAAGRLPEAMGMMRRVCAALGFLHGEGIVHRDLKPDNILVRPDGQPVLVDFGLVSVSGGARGRESLEVGGATEGTSGYMAPEQIGGELVDARADLYSLGCLMHEVVTGRPVFVGEEGEVLRQHLIEPPLPPSRWVAELPAELEGLLLRLLEKRPAERLGYARDVAEVLVRLGAAAGDAAEPEPRAYLYRSGFVGRTEVVKTVEGLLEKARWREGQCLLLGAESGAGKTRLVMELATSAHRQGFRVVTGEGAALEADTPLRILRPLLQALADHCRAAGPRAASAVLGSRGPLLALYEPAFEGLVSEGAGRFDPTALPPQELRQRVLVAVAQALGAFAEEQPLLLVLDDLQWADELSLGVLEHLRREGLAHLPVMVLGTWRPEEAHATLRRLLEVPGVSRVRLDRLEAEAVAAMVCGMLALRTPPLGFVRYLAEQSEGNPFFVTEYLRTAVDEGLLRRDAAGGWRVAARDVALEAFEQALPLPGSLRELLARWLVGLRPEARALLERAAVLGREFDGALLLGEAASGDTRQLEALEALRVRHVLEEVGEGRLRFSHDKLRESAYAGIPAQVLPQLHAEAARALESRYGEGAVLPSVYGALAHHWDLARMEDKALYYLERAARHALARGANGAAVAQLQRALVLHATGPSERSTDRATCEYLLGEAHFGLGELGPAREFLHAALTRLERALPESKPAWGVLLLGQMTRQFTHLVREEPAVAAGASERELLRVAALATSRLCECYYFSQDMLAVAVSALSAVNLAERAGHRGEVRRQYAQLGYMAGLARAHPLARHYLRRAREGSGGAGELAGIATGLWYEASYELTFARWSHAGQRADEAIQLLTRLGSQGDLQIARTLRAHVDYYTGHFEASLARFEEIRDSGRQWSNVQYEAWGLYSMARSLLALGRLDEALSALLDARRLLARQEDRASEVICLGLLAATHLYRGERDAAGQRALEVLVLTEGAQPTAFTEGKGYEGAAVALLALWEAEAAGSSGATASLARRARDAVARLEQCARLFPLVRPAALRCAGLLYWLSGRTSQARATWRQGLMSAQKLGMPYDEALTRVELARHGTPSGVEARAHLLRASELFSLMRCAGHRRQVETLGQA